MNKTREQIAAMQAARQAKAARVAAYNLKQATTLPETERRDVQTIRLPGTVASLKLGNGANYDKYRREVAMSKAMSKIKPLPLRAVAELRREIAAAATPPPRTVAELRREIAAHFNQ